MQGLPISAKLVLLLSSVGIINGEIFPEPLILTPYLNAGKIQEAQNLSKVSSANSNLTQVESYTGYFTVNETYGSSMFFWFFPAQFNRDKAPVILWLQGGPGASSLFGLFAENGPFIVDNEHVTSFRSTSWSLTHSVLYFDSPVGTGYSFTNSSEGYATSTQEVADALYIALTQFFTMFPEYQARDFYATGESYAGKYVPALSSKIHDENQGSPKIRINLNGMIIGNAWTDPKSLLNYGDYLFNVGILDSRQHKYFTKQEGRAKNYIKRNKTIEANEIISELLGGIQYPYPGTLFNMTGLHFMYNFLLQKPPKEMEFYSTFVQQENIRQAIHVGNQPYHISQDLSKLVNTYMRGDIVKSAAYLVSKILDAPQKYKVFLYNGQLDYCVTVRGTELYLDNLKWHGQSDWKSNASRVIWRVGEDVAGYVKVVDNLTFVVVRNAGHMVPFDQPKWSFEMINRFTSGKPF